MLSSFGTGQCFSKHNLVLQIWQEFVCYGFDNIGTWNIYQINLSFFTLNFFQKVWVQNIYAQKKISETNWTSICRKKKCLGINLTYILQYMTYLKVIKEREKMELRFFDYSASNSISVKIFENTQGNTYIFGVKSLSMRFVFLKHIHITEKCLWSYMLSILQFEVFHIKTEFVWSKNCILDKLCCERRGREKWAFQNFVFVYKVKYLACNSISVNRGKTSDKSERNLGQI